MRLQFLWTTSFTYNITVLRNALDYEVAVLRNKIHDSFLASILIVKLNFYGLPVLQATRSTHYITALWNTLDYEFAVLRNWITRLPVFWTILDYETTVLRTIVRFETHRDLVCLFRLCMFHV